MPRDARTNGRVLHDCSINTPHRVHKALQLRRSMDCISDWDTKLSMQSRRTELVSIDLYVFGTKQISDHVDYFWVGSMLEHWLVCIAEIEELADGQHSIFR